MSTCTDLRPSLVSRKEQIKLCHHSFFRNLPPLFICDAPSMHGHVGLTGKLLTELICNHRGFSKLTSQLLAPGQNERLTFFFFLYSVGKTKKSGNLRPGWWLRILYPWKSWFLANRTSAYKSECHRFHEGLMLETSAFLPFTVANLRFQPSC